MKHKNIKERGLERTIKEMVYIKKWTYKKIAQHLNLTMHEVSSFVRDDKLKNYTDDRLEEIAMTDEMTPLSVIHNYFQGVHHASKELAFTGLINSLLREELAQIVAEHGVKGLTKGDNYALLNQWYQNSKKLDGLISNSQKQLETYINLFNQVLDVQREVSYVKMVTDLLIKEDPAMYKRLQKALDSDPAAKRVLDSLSREDVLMYWDSEKGAVVEALVEEDG